MQVVAEAADLARAGHLHAQHRVGAHQPREREHGCLDRHVVQVDGMVFYRAGNPQHSPHGLDDEVIARDLGDEGEAARGAQVALDDLHLVELGQILHVEGAGDPQRLGQRLGDLARLADGRDVERSAAGARAWHRRSGRPRPPRAR